MSDVDEIKHRLNIVDVIGEYTKLQKVGGNFRARCLFHSEKTASFYVSSEKQIWHCFGACGMGGDMFRFIMQIEGVEFGEALTILAKRAGVMLKKFDPERENYRTRLFAINEAATRFFQKALEKTKGGKEALAYLKKRAITQESQEHFKLGYAPSSWRALTKHLEEKGFHKKDIVASGLAIENTEGRVYDRFRARIMFPIFSPTGQVAGFSGRVLRDAKEAKYVNTPQTLIYDKSRELYGMYQAKEALKSKEEAIVMEGNVDVVMSHQAGVKHAIATCGTALTPSHLDMLGRYTKKLIFSFDNDEAGKKASFRAFEIAQAKGFTVYTLFGSSDKDPADIVAKSGANAWQGYVQTRLPFMEYVWGILIKEHPIETIEGKRRASETLFHFLRFLSSEIEKSHWIAEFAKRLGIREESMFQDFQKFEKVDGTISNNYNKDEAVKAQRKGRMGNDRENLIALWLSYPQMCKSAVSVIEESMVKEIREELQLHISDDELSLKAQVFWPSEFLAKRELERILFHFNFLNKKALIRQSIHE